MTRYMATADGEITVEEVDLTHAGSPKRFGDPDGDGKYLLVRAGGRTLAFEPRGGRGLAGAAREAAAVAGVAGWVPLADLSPVAEIYQYDRADRSGRPAARRRWWPKGSPLAASEGETRYDQAA